ncbi:MAG: FHA domain-containing protein [Verrucomicrobia bacterium]|nr:FHA domain-containing protein [Verrucomicrobiota bacterium]
MAKLVVLSAGMTGRTQELKVEKTTIGRVEDNTFQIAEPSVSSHHCEIVLRGNEVVVRDLNSTNGTFINGEKVTESVMKTGQILRLGQIEMRLEPDTSAAPAKKPIDQTMVMQRGVSLTELEQGARGSGFDTKSAGFSKKGDNVSKIFWIVAAVVGLLIVGVLVYALMIAGK